MTSDSLTPDPESWDSERRVEPEERTQDSWYDILHTNSMLYPLSDAGYDALTAADLISTSAFGATMGFPWADADDARTFFHSIRVLRLP